MTNLNIAKQTSVDEDTVYTVLAESPELEMGMQILPSSLDQVIELDPSVSWKLTTYLWGTEFTKTFAAGELDGAELTLRELT